MQIGSLVEFISVKGYGDSNVYLKTPYTVRGMEKCDCGCKTTVIYLEEVQRRFNSQGNEFGFDIRDLREIQPPTDIINIIKELLTIGV